MCPTAPSSEAESSTSPAQRREAEHHRLLQAGWQSYLDED